jgi:hypothetical protein
MGPSAWLPLWTSFKENGIDFDIGDSGGGRGIRL